VQEDIMSNNKLENLTWILYSAMMLMGSLTVYANTATGGSCGDTSLEFNYQCNYTESGSKKYYSFHFIGVNSKDPNAMNPLSVTQVYLTGSSVYMTHVGTNTFYYNSINATSSPSDYSFIYKYKLNNNTEAQCQTPVFQIEDCHNISSH
jgi:hypothetical protein